MNGTSRSDGDLGRMMPGLASLKGSETCPSAEESHAYAA